MTDETFVRRVRFADVDFAQTPFYGRYFSWVDEAWEYELNRHGLWYSELVGARNIGFPITEAICRYWRPLRLDDEFTVDFRITDLDQRGLITEFRFLRLDDGEITSGGHTKRRFVDMDRFAPTQLPADLTVHFERLATSLTEFPTRRMRDP